MVKAKKGRGKNKFIPSFDRKKAEKLLYVLEPLQGGGIYSINGVRQCLEDILQRPSYVRKIDVTMAEEVFKALKRM